MYTILLVIHSIIVLFLIVIVLIQRTDADGLGGLSGGGGNQFMTGRATANLLTRTTAILATAFMITSLTLAIMAGRANHTSILDTEPTPPVTTQPLPLQSEKPVTVPPKSAAQPQKKEAPTPAVPKPE